MSDLSTNVNRWMQDGRARALVLVAESAQYRSVMEQLLFFFTRAMFSVHGTPGKVSKAMGICFNKQRWHMQPPTASLTAKAIESAKLWADGLARQGATYREALFVFKLSLFDAAIEVSNGSRVKAAKLLRVHRNTFLHRPATPAQMQARIRKGK